MDAAAFTRSIAGKVFVIGGPLMCMMAVDAFAELGTGLNGFASGD